MSDQPHYPYADGNHAVLGPDVTATADGMTIRWKGAKYRRDHGAQPDIGDWYEAGCARDCSEQHTYKLGRCALSTEEPPEPTVSIGRVEDFEDGQPGIVLRSIPMPAWDALITVAKWVSRGKSFALDADPDIAPCYPDASARRALGALHDAGLLDQSEPVTVTDPEYLRRQYAAIISALHDNRPDHIAAELLRVRDRHLQQLRQRLQLADELLATRDAELAAAKKTARGIGAWGVLQAIEQALPQGPTVAEAAADDARWPLEKHGE